jgi:hydrogenase maturation protease
MSTKPILVLGLGNLLRSDEGVGIHVVRELSKRQLPEIVEIVDGGTLGAELIGFIQGRKKVFLVDAMKADAPPGSVLRVPFEELNPVMTRSMSVHGAGVGELLYCCGNLITRSEIVIYGIVPKLVDRWSMNLTAVVQSRIPSIVFLILDEITTGEVPRGVVSPKLSLVRGWISFLGVFVGLSEMLSQGVHVMQRLLPHVQ